MNLENNNDLLKFIENEKKQYNDFNNEKIINLFYKCFYKTLIEIHDKFKHIENYNKTVYIGSNIMFNVFWILLNYTNNLTLTIFLSERAVLLFSEFIILSKDPKINKDLCYVPNLSDAINFAYKKTIGPIEISNLSIDKNNSIKNCCFLIKEIIQTLYIKNNNISIYKNEIISICDDIYKLHKLLEDDKIFFVFLKKIINYINLNDIENIQKFITLLLKNKTSKSKILSQLNTID